MTTKKKAPTDKKPKVKKETIKDLDVKNAKGVKGGIMRPTVQKACMW